MLVGEVRCATTATGCSWKLSGGSQLSSGPTYSSKNAQVFRDTLRRKVVCSTLSRAGRRRGPEREQRTRHAERLRAPDGEAHRQHGRGGRRAPDRPVERGQGVFAG